MSGYLNHIGNIIWNINEEVHRGYFIHFARATNEISVSG